MRQDQAPSLVGRGLGAGSPTYARRLESPSPYTAQHSIDREDLLLLPPWLSSSRSPFAVKGEGTHKSPLDNICAEQFRPAPGGKGNQ